MIRISFRYPLSESIAPSGTAWGAEGLRGNEANENNLMVLALAPARKGQSRMVLHNRTWLPGSGSHSSGQVLLSTNSKLLNKKIAFLRRSLIQFTLHPSPVPSSRRRRRTFSPLV
jgi:hypothetical protein